MDRNSTWLPKVGPTFAREMRVVYQNLRILKGINAS